MERNREVRMEVRSQALVDVVEDVICDVCRSGTRIPGYGLNTASLKPNGDMDHSMTESTIGCISASLLFQGAEWIASGVYGQWHVR